MRMQANSIRARSKALIVVSRTVVTARASFLFVARSHQQRNKKSFSAAMASIDIRYIEPIHGTNDDACECPRNQDNPIITREANSDLYTARGDQRKRTRRRAGARAGRWATPRTTYLAADHTDSCVEISNNRIHVYRHSCVPSEIPRCCVCNQLVAGSSARSSLYTYNDKSRPHYGSTCGCMGSLNPMLDHAIRKPIEFIKIRQIKFILTIICNNLLKKRLYLRIRNSYQ